MKELRSRINFWNRWSVFSNEILATTDDVLLIPRFGLAEEVDGRNPTPTGRGVSVGPRVFSEVAVVEENGSEEKECQQSKGITGVASKEGHRECRITGVELVKFSLSAASRAPVESCRWSEVKVALASPSSRRMEDGAYT